ncbi:MAG: STAS domain-containing protein [Armatimonadota bacterium]|nr:STAS domain-containing protein [Armatimonadota bacterium]
MFLVAFQAPFDETSLRISERTDGEIAYVEASGEIDRAGEKTLGQVVDNAISRGARSVIIDLRQVNYMDNGTVQVLMGAKSQVIAWGGEVYVVVEGALPRRVIQMARLQNAVKVCQSVDEAFADIARRATHATRPAG